MLFRSRVQAPEDVPYAERQERPGIRPYEPDVTTLVPPSNCEQPLSSAPHLKRYVDPKSARVLPQHESSIRHNKTDVWETTTMDALRPKVNQHKRSVHRDVASDDVLARRIPASEWVPPVKPPPTFKTAETTYQAFHTVRFEAHKGDVVQEQGDDSRIIGGFEASKNPTLFPSDPVYSHSNQFATFIGKYNRDAYDTTKTEDVSRGRGGKMGEFGRVPELQVGFQIWRDEHTGRK